MIVIDTKVPKTFEDYLAGLSKKGRKDYKRVSKTGAIYKKVEYEREEAMKFMKMWSNQIKRNWSFDISYLDKLNEEGKLLCFATIKDGEKIAFHFLEKHKNYIDSHPPIYNKEKYLKVGLPRFMRFNFIKYAIADPEIEWVDLGGGRNSWRETIKRRHKLLSNRHKWIFISKEAKENPDNQPNLHLFRPEGKRGSIKYVKVL